MSEETNKFVQDMLKKADEKKKTEPQTRFEGVKKEEVEKLTENIQEMIQKGKNKNK